MGGLHFARSALHRAYSGPLLALSSISLAACSGGVLDPLGPVGADGAKILINATVIMLVIVVPTILLAFWIAWHYRASNSKAEYLPYWSYSGRIEAVVWSIPTLTVMFLAGEIWVGSHRLDPFRPLDSELAPLQVQVVALDWKWLFIYPQQHVATVNHLVVPAGRPVHFSITSASVFNVFFVPQLGSMIYAMPGMVSQLHLQADNPAKTWGLSAQFSGDGFSDMQFDVTSVASTAFDGWVATARNGPALDRTAYAGLLHQSHNVPASTFGSIDPHLFDAVATQKIPPGPGPQPGASGHAGREVTPAGKD